MRESVDIVPVFATGLVICYPGKNVGENASEKHSESDFQLGVTPQRAAYFYGRQLLYDNGSHGTVETHCHSLEQSENEQRVKIFDKDESAHNKSKGIDCKQSISGIDTGITFLKNV